MIALSSLLLSVIESWTEGTLMGTKPRMPECHLPSLDQDCFAARTGCPHPSPGHQGNRMKKKTEAKHRNNQNQTTTARPPAEGRPGNAKPGLESLPCARAARQRQEYRDRLPSRTPSPGRSSPAPPSTRPPSCWRCHADRPLQALLDWAATHGTPEDIFLMEAGSNSFEIGRRLHALDLRACVSGERPRRPARRPALRQ